MTFIIRTKAGNPLGRETLDADLGPVPEAFAYVYDDQEHAERVAAQYPGSTVETYGPSVTDLPLATSEEEFTERAKAVLDQAGVAALNEAEVVVQKFEESRGTPLPDSFKSFVIALAPHLGRAGGRAIILNVMREARET